MASIDATAFHQVLFSTRNVDGLEAVDFAQWVTLTSAGWVSFASAVTNNRLMDEARRSLSSSDVMLRHLKFKPLLIFDRVLQRGSILHAARELNLTQSAVTKAVRELEEQLGVQLLERSNRGVAPTDYGRVLGSRIKSVIAEVRYLADELNSFRSGESGHVMVGTLIAGSARLMPLAIIRLKARRPGVLVTVREGYTDRLYPSLASGELDVVVGRLPEQDHPIARALPLEHMALFTEAFCVVVRADHPLTRHRRVTLADTMTSPWVLPVPESPSRLAAERLFRTAGLPLPTDRVESLSMMTNVKLLLESDSCVLMPRGACEMFVERGLLSVLPIEGIGAFGQVGYSVRTDRPPTPAARQFIECLHAAANDARSA